MIPLASKQVKIENETVQRKSPTEKDETKRKSQWYNMPQTPWYEIHTMKHATNTYTRLVLLAQFP